MSLNEFRDWEEFFRYEPLHTQEIQMAMLLAFKAYSKDNKVDYTDFMLSRVTLEDDKEEKLSGADLDILLRSVFKEKD